MLPTQYPSGRRPAGARSAPRRRAPPGRGGQASPAGRARAPPRRGRGRGPGAAGRAPRAAGRRRGGGGGEGAGRAVCLGAPGKICRRRPVWATAVDSGQHHTGLLSRGLLRKLSSVHMSKIVKIKCVMYY